MPATRKTLTDREIEEQSQEILRSLDRWYLPVDPLAIAEEEEIELAPGEYSEGFDARIEYLTDVRSFVLYYRDIGPGRTAGRVRFSVAHELGHYYLHRDYLLAGHAHDSQADFRSRDSKEQEADEFAARLLMPRELFVNEVRRFRQRICTLAELCQLADRVFETSVTSTVRRYCQCDIEPCCLVVSDGGAVKWAVASEDMRRLGMGYVEFGTAVPRMSKTAALWEGADGGANEPVEGEVAAPVWFSRPYRSRLWEEAMLLGRTGLALTYLTVAD